MGVKQMRPIPNLENYFLEPGYDPDWLRELGLTEPQFLRLAALIDALNNEEDLPKQILALEAQLDEYLVDPEPRRIRSELSGKEIAFWSEVVAPMAYRLGYEDGRKATEQAGEQPSLVENSEVSIKDVYLAVEIPKDDEKYEGSKPLIHLVFSKESMRHFYRRRKEWEKDARFRSEWPYELHFYHVDLTNMKVKEVTFGEGTATT